MGKCVSRQATCPSHPAHHQSVLTIALSQQDLLHAHKIWQQLTASNEYIATAASTEEPPFYYHISHNGEQQQQQQDLETETETATEVLEKAALEAVLHIQSVYNHLDAHVNANANADVNADVIGSSLTVNNKSSSNSKSNSNEYATCQDFLLEELLAQQLLLDECQVKNITPHSHTHSVARSCNRSGIRLAAWQLSDSDSDSELIRNLYKGQTESKKHGGKASRRHNGNNGQLESAEQQQQLPQQTKGTAMSFGFRKKLNGTPKKLKKLLEGERTQTDTKDDNGNAAAPPVQFEKVGVALAQRTGAANKRFGYRGTPPRPASTTGLTTNTTNVSEDTEESAANAQNNNNNSTAGNVLVSNLKRRSKSAHAGRTIDGEPKIAQPKTLTFNLNQNTTIEYQRRQFFGEIADEPMATNTSRQQHQQQQQQQQQRYNYNNLANMHANVIVRPTPRAAPASFAKFTLQTVSLPRPEYPVAISLTATTPTTPSSSVQSPVPTHATGARAKDIATTTSRPHPLTSIHVQPTCKQLDQKSVKQLTNNTTRRGFSGSREISADSGIASMDMAVDSGSSSGGSGTSCSKRSRSRPRNLQMVMSGRHTFEVRDLLHDDPPSSESNSFVETLALPKLPTDNSQTMPLPLVGLVRSNTVLSRESYERRQAGQDQAGNANLTPELPPKPKASGSDDSESVDEEKLYLDSSTSEKSAKHSQSSSMSWRCQAGGESLALRDCSSMSINSSSDTQAVDKVNDKEEDMSLGLDDISLMHTEMDLPFSTISSITEPAAKAATGQEHLLNMNIVDNREIIAVRLPSERPRSFNNALNESKFAELALASSTCLLLDDETSPTDSLVSSTEESEEAAGKLKKHKHNAELQQKQDFEVDIDDISPVLELELDPGSRSPHSPGTPTHASQSLSLGSDCGNLIDDEIADQPALLCNSEMQEMANTDTPTLMETHTGSLRSLKSQSKARTALQQAIELSLRTPAAVRRAVLQSAESLDTLSPCESICSDDLMMDFDLNSSVDSIDRHNSLRHSRSGSDLHKLGTDLHPDQAETEAELLAQLDCQGSDVMKELNTLLRVRMQRSAPSPRERISAKLPARATRLLNRSRLQDQQQLQLTGNDSDNSLRSTHSGASSRKRSTAASRASTASSTSSLQRRQQQQQQLSATASSSRRTAGQSGHNNNTELHSSSDDLMLYDKSFRNAMIQDVLQFKKQLLRLRRILQEEGDLDLTRTETLNPFENDNMQLFAACGLDSKQLTDIDLASLTSSTTEDPLQELSDLRRQVVYLQGQVDDRDRTIRLQRDLIEQLEAEKRQANGDASGQQGLLANKERISMATQTERTRPLAIGAEGLSRSKPEYTSYTTHFPTLHLHCNDSTVAATTIIRHQQQQQPCNGNNSNHSNHSNNNNNNSNNSNNNNSNCRALSQTRRHTIISTTLTNYNQQLAAAAYPRRASIGWDAAEASTPATVAAANVNSVAHKPVRITLIGESLPQQNGVKILPQTQQQNGIKILPQQNGVKTLPTTQQNGVKILPSTQQQNGVKALPSQQNGVKAQQNGVKARFLNGCQGSSNSSSGQGNHHHYQPLYNSNKMTNPTVTIV